MGIEIADDFGRGHVDEPPPWADDEVSERDAEAARMLDEVKRNQEISKEADRIRIREAAHARVRAEKVAGADYGSLFVDRAQLLDLPAPEPLIDLVLPRHAYAILRGRDQSFKSFVAIDWACCLATGKPWLANQADKVRVLYVAGEGAHGISRRIDAWEYAWSENIPPAMLTVRKAALDLHQPGPAFDHLLDHISTGGYGLVVIDTLRRVAGAADGNSSEMGLVVDNLDRIKHATTNGTVLAIAHTDKADNDTRGYSGIEDDADVVWAIKRDEMTLTLDLIKMKDGPDGRTLHLVANRTLNSLTLSDLGGPAKVNTTATQIKILDAMREMFPDGATGPQLLGVCGLAKATFHRALKDLLEAGHLLNTGTKQARFFELPALTDEEEPTS